LAKQKKVSRPRDELPLKITRAQRTTQQRAHFHDVHSGNQVELNRIYFPNLEEPKILR
jgi:hypothetical protein